MAGKHKRSHVIDGVEATSDTLTSRGGLTLFVRYLRNIAIYPVLARRFGSIRKNAKGKPVSEIFKQVFCFLLAGTSRHLVYFDALKKDEGYAAAIETAPDQMLPSHAVKRFFGAFSWYRIWLFRSLLQQLFRWRLQMRKPKVVVLGMDTDELVHRGLKDFGFEELPFLRLAPNAALSYTTLAAFFPFECFKEDVCGEVIPVEA